MIDRKLAYYIFDDEASCLEKQALILNAPLNEGGTLAGKGLKWDFFQRATDGKFALKQPRLAEHISHIDSALHATLSETFAGIPLEAFSQDWITEEV